MDSRFLNVIDSGWVSSAVAFGVEVEGSTASMWWLCRLASFLVAGISQGSAKLVCRRKGWMSTEREAGSERGKYRRSPSTVSLCRGSHSFNSLAIFDAIFLKPMLVPDILLKRTPLSERRGSLHTSISHCTRLSALGSPYTHSSRNLSRCS